MGYVMAVMEWSGMVRSVEVWTGAARCGSHGAERSGGAGYGGARRGMARLGSQGEARFVREWSG